MKRDYFHSETCRAFTLLELLASMVVLGLIVVMLFGVFQQTSKAWQRGESHVETFTQARAALDLISRDLSQALATNTIPFFASEDRTTLGTLSLPRGNLAFVAAVGDSATDGIDLMEVVYRLSRGPRGTSEAVPPSPWFFTNSDPPFSLIRRVSGFTPTRCRDYGRLLPCPLNNTWNFYASPADWPETSDSTRTAVVAENVIALRFYFLDVSGKLTRDSLNRSFWNSTDAKGWTHELGDNATVRAVEPASKVQPPASSADMLNHAPAQVAITLTLLDTKAAARFSAVSDPNAKMRIYQESKREFTTSVSIPNRQP
jgi:prepilin-type N-terminal cleavage/methylation domain-containing protein